MKPKLLVSACLLGTPCRYDGKSKKNEAVCALAERFELIPVCPEVLGGLPTPRTPSERRAACVVRKDGRDVTAEYRRGAECALETARRGRPRRRAQGTQPELRQRRNLRRHVHRRAHRRRRRDGGASEVERHYGLW